MSKYLIILINLINLVGNFYVINSSILTLSTKLMMNLLEVILFLYSTVKLSNCFKNNNFVKFILLRLFVGYLIKIISLINIYFFVATFFIRYCIIVKNLHSRPYYDIEAQEFVYQY
jgi:hypothetical protein